MAASCAAACGQLVLASFLYLFLISNCSLSLAILVSNLNSAHLDYRSADAPLAYGFIHSFRRCLERSDRCVMTLIIDVRLHCYENERGSQIFCTGKRLHPAVLTSQIKQARTIQALVCTYSSHESHLNCIHVSACWIAFDKLARQLAERTGLWKNANALQPLVQCTV